MKKLVLLSVLVALMLAPAIFAADKTVNFYGRVCVTTAIVSGDKEYTGFGESDSDTVWDMTDARFGADFAQGDVKAKVEIRSNLVSSNMTRHWYGAWNFGAGTLVVGRTWAPTFQAITDSDLGATDVFGDFNGSLRDDGLQLWFDVGGGSLHIAALTPITTGVAGATDPGIHLIGTGVAPNDADTTLPKLEVSYNHKFGMVDATFFGGYNSTSVDYKSAAYSASADIESWVLGGNFAIEFKPAFIKGLLYIGQNLNNYGADPLGLPAMSFLPTGGTNMDVADADFMGYALLAGFDANDKIQLEAGYCHAEAENSFNGNDGLLSGNVKYEVGGNLWYVMATIKLADNVYVYPEIVKHDLGDLEVTVDGTKSKEELGTYTVYGIYWRINF